MGGERTQNHVVFNAQYKQLIPALPGGTALVDTGASEDLLGSIALTTLQTRLIELELKAISLPRHPRAASGIGGQSRCWKLRE